MRAFVSHLALIGLGVSLAAGLVMGCAPLPPPFVLRTDITPTVTETIVVARPPTAQPTQTRTTPPTSTPLASATPAPKLTRTPPRTVTPVQTVALIHASPAVPTDTLTATPWPTPIWPPSPLDQTDNILIMGIDQRPDEVGWRTDTLMAVAIDRQSNQVGVISIPRDLYVEIPGLGNGRINQVDYFGEETEYPGGGPALLRRVLTETLGIPTQHYVRIRMDGFVRMVDALGGVTVTLDCPLFERTPNESMPNGVLDWTLPAGPVHLDGETAKKYATYRYATTDFGRARRQQQLIWAIRDRALQLNAIPRIPELWKALADTFSTDLGLLDIVKLAQIGATLQSDKVHGVVLGGDVMDYYITPEGAWVLVIFDYDRIAAEKEQLFTARPLAEFNVSTEGGGCPPAPTPPPTFTPTPTPAPS